MDVALVLVGTVTVPLALCTALACLLWRVSRRWPSAVRNLVVVGVSGLVGCATLMLTASLAGAWFIAQIE